MAIGDAVDNAAETSGDLNKEAWDKHNLLRAAVLVYHDTDGSHLSTGDVVLKALFDANTILAANADDTPAALTVAASRIIGRASTGNIAALTAAQVNTILSTATKALDNLASVAINTSLISDTDDTDDLGSSTKQWKDLYIDGTANIDSLVADTADINGGTVDGITSLTAGGNLDIGAHNLQAATLTADGLTATRVIFAGASGLLSDNAAMTFVTDTLTVTKLGAFQATGAINFDSQNMTNVDIDSGTIGGVTLNGAIAGGDQTFSNVGDITFATGSILKSGSTNTNTLLLAANDTTFITLTTGDPDTLGIGAFTLGGKLTGGASEIEGTGFDINGGTIDGVTIGGAAAPTVTDLGTVTTCDIDGGTVGGVTLDGTVAGGDQAFTGVGDMTFTAGSLLKSGATGADTLLLAANDTTFITLTTGATDTLDIGAFTLGGKLTAGANEIEGSAFDIDGGDISAGTVSGGLTWSAAQNLGAYQHFINDTANTFMTIGLTINQGSNDDDFIAAKSSDVTHTCTLKDEADTWYSIKKHQDSSGGAWLSGYKSGDGDPNGAILFTGILDENANTTKSTTGPGIIRMISSQVATNDWATVVADGNLMSIEDNTVVRFIFDKEGEMHSDAVIGVGDDWDEWDDLALASDVSRLTPGKYDEMLTYHAKDFEKAGLVTLSTDKDGVEHAFIKNKAMHLFSMNCFREVYNRMIRYERAFEKLGIDKNELVEVK